jgi:hypothetical protein
MELSLLDLPLVVLLLLTLVISSNVLCVLGRTHYVSPDVVFARHNLKDSHYHGKYCWLTTVFHKELVGMFVIYASTKFYMPSSKR